LAESIADSPNYDFDRKSIFSASENASDSDSQEFEDIS
jgi:hypothetical protein